MADDVYSTALAFASEEHHQAHRLRRRCIIRRLYEYRTSSAGRFTKLDTSPAAGIVSVLVRESLEPPPRDFSENVPFDVTLVQPSSVWSAALWFESTAVVELWKIGQQGCGKSTAVHHHEGYCIMHTMVQKSL